MPPARVSGATRGEKGSGPLLLVLAPDHIGLTVQEQPVLQRYQSNPAGIRFEFALLIEKTINPLLEIDLGVLQGHGSQQLNLADNDIRLSPGVSYQWSVVLVPGPESHANDIVASGMNERIEMPEGFSERLTRASEREVPSLYADAGIWYDALAALAKLIATNPGDATLIQQRAQLLQQVDLPGIGMPAAAGEGL